jgi:hypothetical protein
VRAIERIVEEERKQFRDFSWKGRKEALRLRERVKTLKLPEN